MTDVLARPGGRTARVRAQVLSAAGDLLVERGFDQLDLTAVAQRARVGKTTIYRRWGSVTRLIGDLLSDMAEQSVPRAATGSLRGDLRANAELVARTLADPRQGRLFRAVIAASLCDAGAAEALRLFYRVRVQEWSGCVRDAIDRGEPRRTPTAQRWSVRCRHRCTTGCSPPTCPWTSRPPTRRRTRPGSRPGPACWGRRGLPRRRRVHRPSGRRCTGELTAAIGTGDRSTWSARCPLAARRKWKADGHERVEQ